MGMEGVCVCEREGEREGERRENRKIIVLICKLYHVEKGVTCKINSTQR
jgi:hypothetical protein